LYPTNYFRVSKITIEHLFLFFTRRPNSLSFPGHDVISMFFYGLRGTFFWWRISILRLRKVLTWFLRKQWATTLPPPAERV